MLLQRNNFPTIIITAFSVVSYLFSSSSIAQPSDNCQCIWQGSFSKVVKHSDLIVSGKIISHKGNAMDMEINRILVDKETNGKEFNQDIRIWGDDGKECRPKISEFPVDSDWLLALKKIAIEPQDGFNPNTPNVSFGRKNDYYLSMCGAYWLEVHDDFVSGNLVNGQRWQWINKKMNPVLIDLVAAYTNGVLPDQALVEASKPQSASKKLMNETLQDIDRSALSDFTLDEFPIDDIELRIED